MDIFKINSTIAIKSLNNKKINDGTFNANHIYLLEEDSTEILITDSKLTKSNKIKINKHFNKITYDSLENCFWAYSKKLDGSLFKLNEHMDEVGYLHIPNCYTKEVQSLNFNRNHNLLTLKLENKIIELNKKGIIANKINFFRNFLTKSIYCSNNFSIAIATINAEDFILIANNKGLLRTFKLPNDLNFSSIIDCNNSYNTFELTLLVYDKFNHSYLSNCSLTLNKNSKSCNNYYLEGFTHQCNSFIDESN
ncbi:MAG: hypothetical protein ACRDD2_13615 [Sarcina sp.]